MYVDSLMPFLSEKEWRLVTYACGELVSEPETIRLVDGVNHLYKDMTFVCHLVSASPLVLK